MRWDNECEHYFYTGKMSNKLDRQDAINRDFRRFKSGYKSRDTEVKELEEKNIELDKMNCMVNTGRVNLHKKLDEVENQNKILREALENIKKKYVIQNQTELYREQVADIYFIASNALSKTGGNDEV